MDEQTQFMTCKPSSSTWPMDLRILAFCLVFLLLLSVPTALCADWRYEACSKNFSSCKEGPSITYPFWISGEQESFCGLPDFQLTCKKGKPTINLSTSDYVVSNITYQDQTLRVIDAKVQAESGCSSQIQNLSLNGTPFRYGPNQADLYLYFNCSQPLPSEFLVYKINCSRSSSLALLNHTLWDKAENLGYCNPPVIAPVNRDGSGVADVSSYSTELLKEGFDLVWNASGCSRCQRSGGICGYNDTAHSFRCMCRDRPHLAKCGSSMNLSVKLIIGFSSLAGGIIIGCGAFFIYNRRRYRKGGFFNAAKARSLSSPSFSAKMQSNPTSTELENGSAYFEFGVHVFAYQELEDATNNFNSDKQLGDGGYGTVYYGKLRDGREVAVKRLYENNYKRVEQFMNEIHILTRLRHQSLVTLYGCTSRHCRELLLVYEFIPNGTVADHLHGDRKTETGSLSWPIRMNIAIETATALSYLHVSDIIHRDVKTNNILLDNNFRVKVADFGISRLFPTDVTHVSTAPQGTPGYVDPDYHQCYQLTDKSDVYSFGVVLIELISSKPAVDITRHRHEINLSNLAINKIQSQALHELVDPCLGFDSDYTVKRKITAVAELAFRCLQLEKDMRPAMDEVLECLKQIEKEDHSMKPEVVQDDTTELLKNPVPPVSPDTVITRWISESSTPNISA